ncbi:DUF3800 domain-containing protein [Sphingomonas flavalba]|uniref:DUF3800 domain-containing protein n=1 Tax=Sphingomonas flavalba TaxID=2559804 RepID=UPI001447B34D|nr:DUF3800 domain-containing protein [Sphingomonas flavalba]
MHIYCDESGGLSAGAMTFAAVAIDPDAADALVRRFKAIAGLGGELKGSRISLVERALVLELLERFGGRAVVTDIRRPAMPDGILDVQLYSALLESSVTRLLPESGGCAQVVIDDGRYAPATLALVRADIAALIGPCGRARLADSKRSSGVQIADVISNCAFNLAIGSVRARRIDTILTPFVAEGRIRIAPLPADALAAPMEAAPPARALAAG